MQQEQNINFFLMPAKLLKLLKIRVTNFVYSVFFKFQGVRKIGEILPDFVGRILLSGLKARSTEWIRFE